MYVSEQCFEICEGIIPNPDFVEDEQAFEDLQNHLINTLLPLIHTDCEELNKQFQIYFSEVFTPFHNEFTQNVEYGENIKKEAIKSLPQSQLQAIMKSIEQKLTTELKPSEKIQVQYGHFNIHLILMKVIKDKMKSVAPTSIGSVSECLARVDIQNHSIFTEIGIE